MTVEEPHIARADIVAALQVVRDVAALELPVAHRADVDAAVNAIADALARDDLQELQDALADLETLGPRRLAPNGVERAGGASHLRLGMLVRALEQYEPHSTRTNSLSMLPVAIYVSDEAVHEEVETALDGVLAAAGLTVVERDEPVLGSWFRRMRAAVSRAARSPAARETVRSALHSADTRLLQRPDAEVTALFMQNLGPLLGSLQPTKDAVVRVGAVLVVKVEWTVVVHQLTPGQQLLLDHSPHLEASPHTILAALGASPASDPAAAPPA
ncbi:CATRA system-associated protein [Streptomyces sp. NPDC127051]|uniref:CATRA system-associated protein n=1 Tax=Streptomyces sp. NPDC127051 TaxID=3347119 RepID=UPI00364F3A8E